MGNNSSYWWKSLFILLLATGFFLLFKSVFPDQLFPEHKPSNTENVVVDEWAQLAKKNTPDSTIAGLDTLLIDSSSQYGIEKDSIDSLSIAGAMTMDTVIGDNYLEYFYKQLIKLENKPDATKVRIAYFGDSMTDGDRIVKTVRKLLQHRFGGVGVGFVQISSESARSRGSITHRFSENWTEYAFMNRYEEYHPFGVHGHVYYADDSIPSYVKFSTGILAQDKYLHNPVLIYGKAQDSLAYVRFIKDNDTSDISLKPDKLVNTQVLYPGKLLSFKIEFMHPDSIPFYGVDFNGQHGIQVDNYSKRGNSGLPLTQLNINLMHAFQQYFSYDLIILHYGTNVLNESATSYAWYGRGMNRVIRHLRKAFPQTSILLISAADKATKYGTEMKTDTTLHLLLDVQRDVATNGETGFINLFRAMGGKGSMVRWVEQEPKMANPDYTHFNYTGAQKIAHLIYEEIMDGYSVFKSTQQQEKKQIKQENYMKTDVPYKANNEENDTIQ